MPACQKKIEKLERHIDREEQEGGDFSLEKLLGLYYSLPPEGRAELESLLRAPPPEDKSG